MSLELPPTESDLCVVLAFVDQIVARGLMASSSVEVETIRRLVRGQRVHVRNTSERLAYLKRSGLGYFTDEILASARQISEEIVSDPEATSDRGLLLARVVLGDRAALAACNQVPMTPKTKESP